MPFLKKRRPRVEWLEQRALLAPVVSAFPLLTSQAYPLEITADSGGTLWFTESAASGGKIGEFNPATEVLTEIPLPTVQGSPHGIAIGSDGNVWFTEFGYTPNLYSAGAPSQIGEVNVATGQITEIPLADASAGPTGIVAGPAGTLYFVQTGAIGEIEVSSQQITTYSLSSSSEAPTSIAIGDDGNAWYTAPGVIGRFDLTTHQTTEFTIPSGDSDPQTIINRPGGDLWFTDADKIGRIRSIAVTNTSPFDVPSNATYTLPTGQTFGPGATVPAGTVLPAGTIVEYTLPAGAQGAYGITNTSSDFLYFTLGVSDQIGYINADTGAVQLYAAPGGPKGVVSSGGSIWFPELGNNALGVAQFEGPWYSRALLVSPQEPTTGDDGTFRLNVTSQATGTPSGTVVFTLDGVAQPAITLDALGTASFTPTGLTNGTHLVTASYSGDANFLPSSSNTAYTIVIGTNEDATSAAINRAVATVMQQDDIPGLSVAVVRPGEAPFVQGYGLADAAAGQVVSADTPFEIASVTKTFTGIAVLLLAQDPSLITKRLAVRFDINEPIDKYLSDDPANGFRLPLIWDDITTYELLAMSSGIPDLGTNDLTWQQNLQNAATQPLAGAPGTGYLYSDTAFVLLGELIQQLSGQTYSSFIQAEILNPLGMASTVVRDGTSVQAGQATGYAAFDANSGTWLVPSSYRPGVSSFAAGAITTTAKDTATYLEALLEQKILSPASYAAMFSPIPLLTFATPTEEVVRGLGWDSVTITDNGSEIAKNGALPGFGAEYIVWPEQDIAVGVMSNTKGFDIIGLARAIYDAVQSARPTTSTALSASSTSLTPGKSLEITATVTPASGNPPGGQVVFTVDGVSQPPLALTVIQGTASAMLSLPGLALGAHLITAQYSGSIDYSGSSAMPLVVSVVPPDGPRVDSVVRLGVHYYRTRLVISFDTPLDEASAQNVSSYSVTPVTIAGRSRPIKIVSASYDPATMAVTLRTRSRLVLRRVYRLVVSGTGPYAIRDSTGLPLDGQANGQPGSDYTSIITLANLARNGRKAVVSRRGR